MKFTFSEVGYFLVIIEEIKTTPLFHNDTLDTAAYRRFSRHAITFICPSIKQEDSGPVYTQVNWEEQSGEDNFIAKGKMGALSMLRDQWPSCIKWSGHVFKRLLTSFIAPFISNLTAHALLGFMGDDGIISKRALQVKM